MHPIALAQHLGSGLYGAGADAADFWRRINYDPYVHNQIPLLRQGVAPRDASRLAMILMAGSTYANRRFDPISPEQNANYLAMLKHMGYLPYQAL